MLGREGQKGKKQEDFGPVRVVRTVGALPSVGNRWWGDAMGARRLASAPARAE